MEPECSLFCFTVMGLTSTVVNALLINESQNIGQLDSNLSHEPCDVPKSIILDVSHFPCGLP